MKTLHIGALAALLATAAPAWVCAQAPTPSPAPSAASSPHQREVTGSTAPEAATSNGTDASDDLSPHQREAVQGSIKDGSDGQAGRRGGAGAFVKAAAQDGMTEVEL